MNHDPQNRQPNEDEAMEPVVAPGKRLRAAREARNLTTVQVAQQLKLKNAYIEALEEDDYQRLPSLLYVRGYLKCYARLLGLPEQEVTAAFAQLGLTEEVPVPHGAILTSKQRRRGERMVLKWGSAVIVVAMAALLVAWFQGESTTQLLARLGLSQSAGSSGNDLTPPLPAVETAQQSPVRSSGDIALVRDQSPPIATTAPETNEPQVNTAATDVAATDVADGIEATARVGTASESVSAAVTETPSSGSGGGETKSTQSPESESTSGGKETVSSSGSPGEAPVTVSGTALEPPDSASDEEGRTGQPGTSLATLAVDGVGRAESDFLELTLQADSWAEITDASGDKLVYRLLRAGDVHRVSGRGPFPAFLGHAPAVEVRFNDEPVTNIRVNRNGVARFTLGNS